MRSGITVNRDRRLSTRNHETEMTSGYRRRGHRISQVCSFANRNNKMCDNNLVNCAVSNANSTGSPLFKLQLPNIAMYGLHKKFLETREPLPTHCYQRAPS